jgi:hypothetical protein
VNGERIRGTAGEEQRWTELARQYDGTDRWYLEALGIGADGKWETFLPVWKQIAGEAWKQKAGRDIVWRSRTETARSRARTSIVDGSGSCTPGCVVSAYTIARSSLRMLNCSTFLTTPITGEHTLASLSSP